MDIKEFFSHISEVESFQRVDEEHILDIYLGLDYMSRFTLFLISEDEPKRINASQIINVQVGIRKDNRWGLSFSLTDKKYEDIFVHFCIDIIESSRTLESRKNGAEFICTRYNYWQSMLAKNKGGALSASTIKGLIGEIIFLRDYLIPRYGHEIALNSWIGPEKAKQDFVCEDLWYEVKSTVTGSDRVGISSVEQLDTFNKGELVIIYLDKTSHSDTKKIAINDLVREMNNYMATESLKVKLNGILLNLGYYQRDDYDTMLYKFNGMERFTVESDFPCLRKGSIPDAVIDIKYDLSIPMIRAFKKE